MNKSIILTIIILLFALNHSFAQDWLWQKDSIKQASVEYIMEDRLDSLVAWQIEHNKTDSVMSGFRVQIFFASDRANAEKTIKKFEKEFPDIAPYLVYEQPYFKVRVGDYKTRLEAEKWNNTIGKKFGGSFVVPDEIYFGTE